MCERSSQNGPGSNFTSKNVMCVVHVLVKRSNLFENPYELYSSLHGNVWSVANLGDPAPHLTKLTSRQRHLTYVQEIWHIYNQKCLMFRDAVQQTMDKYNIEEDKSTHTLIIPCNHLKDYLLSIVI